MIVVVRRMGVEMEEVLKGFEWGRVMASRDDTQVAMWEHLQQFGTASEDEERSHQ